MTDELAKLSIAALTIGFVHTAIGPDHYVPFVAMARIGRWSLPRTITITLLCGVGHILGSMVIGLIGVAAGIALFSLETIESVRGDIAGWMLLAFGLAYLVWGIRRAVRNRPHSHLHAHDDGTVHTHEHVHERDHLHVHHAHSSQGENTARMTPWILFTIFLFGPCEPLIPMLMYPAAQGSIGGVVWVTALFGLATLATMTTIVVAMYWGSSFLGLGRFERYGQAVAGLVILLCGAAIQIGL